MSRKYFRVTSGYTQEQVRIISSKKNILVEACAGSGKTNILQKIAEQNSYLGNRLLYLTYNSPLRRKAQEMLRSFRKPYLDPLSSRVKGKFTRQQYNVEIFTWSQVALYLLDYIGISYDEDNAIPTLLQHEDSVKRKFEKIKTDGFRPFQLILIDEYQDMNDDHMNILRILLFCGYLGRGEYPRVIAMGDMNQKIHDMAIHNNARDFLCTLLQPEVVRMETSFRFSDEYAQKLGRVWGRALKGENPKFKFAEISTTAAIKIIDAISAGKVKRKFNSIKDGESKFEERLLKSDDILIVSQPFDEAGIKILSERSALETATFNNVKGLEKSVVFICGFTRKHFIDKIRQSNLRYETTRNLFCVAASRANSLLYFVKGDALLLKLEEIPKLESIKEISDTSEVQQRRKRIGNSLSDRAPFQIRECFNLLKVNTLQQSGDIIEYIEKEGSIRLEPVILPYINFSYFESSKYEDTMSRYRFAREIQENEYTESSNIPMNIQYYPVIHKVDKLEPPGTTYLQALYMTAVAQNRFYYTTVTQEVISEENLKRILDRLETMLPKSAKFSGISGEIGELKFSTGGNIMHENTLYKLKFTKERLTQENHLELAIDLLISDYPRGILWNLYNNIQVEIEIPDRAKFAKYIELTINRKPFPSQ